jgi:hypothetical protein
MAVGPHEHGVVAGRRPVCDPSTDLRGHPVRLLRAGREHLEPDGSRSRRSPLGSKPLADAGAHLQPVRVVEPDQAIGRVEHEGQRAVVPPQHDGSGPRVPILEGEDVVDRRAAEGVDRLVVVAHDGDVSMVLAEERHKLGLGAIGVLELVDQDVLEAAGDHGARGGRGADEPQRE